MIVTIAARELRSLFLSPLAWTLLAVVQFLLAWIFLLLVEDYLRLQPRLLAIEAAPGVTDLVAAPVLRVAVWLLLGMMPLLTMRLISEERRSRTLDLLMSAPLAVYEIVLGKFLGVLGFLLLQLVLVAAMILSLSIGAQLDYGKLLAGLLGLGLQLAGFAAAGLYLSTWTRQPPLAAGATFGLLLLLWLIDSAGSQGDSGVNVFSYLSFLRHYDALLRGLFDTADVAYYVLFIILFLGLAMRRLGTQRLRG